ncbi:MAG TPA: hypothetical protein VF082_09110, partial [Jiangellaceae bacterium]
REKFRALRPQGLALAVQEPVENMLDARAQAADGIVDGGLHAAEPYARPAGDIGDGSPTRRRTRSLVW